MKTITIIILIFTLLIVHSAWANPVDQQTAHRAALAWLNICPNLTKCSCSPVPEIVSIQSYKKTQIGAYVLQLEPKGFIIVSPDNNRAEASSCLQ